MYYLQMLFILAIFAGRFALDFLVVREFELENSS